ncbi:MAG: hypothetical protein DMG49_06285 [Acidobacteria bacterium]|nr:MAG: hypothetical protein DMG49_06285 [Acidobacteriota bacterium]
MQRHTRHVILNFLRERIGEPSEAPHIHWHCEVLAFDVVRGDVFHVWTPSNRYALAADALSRTVANLA